MGLPDDYELPANYNEAYHLTGDGVAVPVVRHLAQHLFEPVLEFIQPQELGHSRFKLPLISTEEHQTWRSTYRSDTGPFARSPTKLGFTFFATWTMCQSTSANQPME